MVTTFLSVKIARPAQDHPARRRRLGALTAAGAAAAVIALAACGSEEPAASPEAGAPQTVAAGPDVSGTSVLIRQDMDVIGARIPAPSAGSDTAQVEVSLADASTAGADTLVAASSPAARAIVFTTNGHTVPKITVPAAPAPDINTGPPNQDRVLLTGLRGTLRAGQTVTLTLVFAHAGQATLQVPVIPPVP
ncbi:MAG TPA: copper chaperone PCu(A)C [Trebonia sp.]